MDDKTLFRSDIARGIELGQKGVDRENGVIYGFAVVSKGEIHGHGLEADNTTLDQVVELGNALEIGAKSRFGHPNMSNTALGTFLGRSKNFRKDGDITRADLYFDPTSYKTPHGDLATYVMDLAVSDPNAFGSSIVFDGTKEVREEEDGTPKLGEDGKPMLPLARITKLWGVDAVDDPAANAGMFGETFFTEGIKISAEMTKLLDKILLNPKACEVISNFFQRYTLNKDEVDEILEFPTVEQVAGKTEFEDKFFGAEEVKPKNEGVNMEQIELEVSQFIDGLKKDGKILPKFESILKSLLVAISASKDSIEAEVNGEKKSLTITEAIKKIFEGMPNLVHLEELDQEIKDKGAKSAREQLLEEIDAVVAEKKISWDRAYKELLPKYSEAIEKEKKEG